MKRMILAVLLVGVIGIALVFGLVRVVSAQDDVPATPPAPGYGRWGWMGQGMMGGEYGPMHETMEAALAGKLGLTEDELEERHDQGQTFLQIAEEKGFTVDEARQMMLDARSAALDQMVKDGTLTQEQADWMKQRSGRMMGGTGAGGCLGTGTPRGGGMMGGRWNRGG